MNTHDILISLTKIQKVQPYSGWDISELKKWRGNTYAIIAGSRPVINESDELNYILTAIDSYDPELKHWNITKLNKVTDEIRMHLGLPSIEDLNPDIKKMRESLKEARNTPGSLMYRFTQRFTNASQITRLKDTLKAS